MNANLSEEQIKTAKKRAKDKIDFLGHLLSYVVVNAILFTINMVSILTTDSDTLWFYWVGIFWGIGLFIHFVSVYVFDGIFSDIERKIEEREMRRIAK